jgi:hypothetical protein
VSKLDAIKNKIRSSSSQSVHASLIGESTIIQEDKKANSQPDNKDTFASDFVKPLLPPPKKHKKQKFEDMYSRDTVWFKNEIKQKISEATEGERGEKTRIINEALEDYFRKHSH